MKGYIEQVKRILVEMLDKSHFGKDRDGVPTLNSKASGAIKRHWGGMEKASRSNFPINAKEVKRKVLAKGGVTSVRSKARAGGGPEAREEVIFRLRNELSEMDDEISDLREENERLRKELESLRSKKVAPVPKNRKLEETEPETANTLVADIERQLSLGADRYVGWTLGQAKAALISGGKPRITVIRYVKKYGPRMRDNLGERLLAWWG